MFKQLSLDSNNVELTTNNVESHTCYQYFTKSIYIVSLPYYKSTGFLLLLGEKRNSSVEMINHLTCNSIFTFNSTIFTIL